jgi:hypothetical protein
LVVGDVFTQHTVELALDGATLDVHDSHGVALAGLTLGGLGGSALAVLTGYAFSAPSQPQVSAGSYVDVPLSLGATGWLLIWPIFSVGYCFFAQLWTLETQNSEESSQSQIAQLDEIGN